MAWARQEAQLSDLLLLLLLLSAPLLHLCLRSFALVLHQAGPAATARKRQPQRQTRRGASPLLPRLLPAAACCMLPARSVALGCRRSRHGQTGSLAASTPA